MKYKLIITDKEGGIVSDQTYHFIEDLLMWTIQDRTKLELLEEDEAETIINEANKLQTISEEK